MFLRLAKRPPQRLFDVLDATKAGYLNFHQSNLDRLAGTGPIEKHRGVTWRFDEERSSHLVVLAVMLPLLKSLLCVVLATVGALLIDRVVPYNLVPIIFLIPVVIAATRWGTWPAITAALGGTAAVDFFFLAPYYTFNIDDPRDAVHLLLFLFVALVSSNLASRLRNETETLRRRETELQYLYELSRRLAACFTIPDLISAVQSYLALALGQQTVFFVATADGQFEPPTLDVIPREVQERIVSMIATTGLAACTVFDKPKQNVWLLRTVPSDATAHGVIAVNIGAGSRAAIETRTGRVEAILDEAALTLQRLDIGKAMEDARLQLQAQLLKDALHGMLSHELRSPLAAIQGSASVLGSAPAVREDVRLRSLTEAITDEVQRLDGFISNLVNAARVTASSVQPRLEWADPKDIVSAAVKLRSRRLADHRLRISFDDDLPLIHVDSALVEEACGQLLENAAKYSPSGSVISVVGRAELARVILSVSDQGVGITPDEQDRLGQRSFRSPRHTSAIPGSGLGFWIASSFIKANGGTIEISSRGEGLGTTASIVLPASWEVSGLTALTHE
jgi:two-component system, OmpR family, sensor histidine kinase KdpD